MTREEVITTLKELLECTYIDEFYDEENEALEIAIKELDRSKRCVPLEDVLSIIHNTIYQFFDICGDEEEVPLSDKDKILLEVNKVICNNIKALESEVR